MPTDGLPRKSLKDLMAFFAPLRGERGSKYGPFDEDMEVVGCIMGILGAWYHKCNPKKKLKAWPRWWAAIFFVVVKLVRACTGRYHEDNAIDGAHYLCQAVTMQKQEADNEPEKEDETET